VLILFPRRSAEPRLARQQRDFAARRDAARGRDGFGVFESDVLLRPTRIRASAGLRTISQGKSTKCAHARADFGDSDSRRPSFRVMGCGRLCHAGGVGFLGPPAELAVCPYRPSFSGGCCAAACLAKLRRHPAAGTEEAFQKARQINVRVDGGEMQPKSGW